MVALSSKEVSELPCRPLTKMARLRISEQRRLYGEPSSKRSETQHSHPSSKKVPGQAWGQWPATRLKSLSDQRIKRPMRLLFWDSNPPPLKTPDKIQTRSRTRTSRTCSLLFWAPLPSLEGRTRYEKHAADHGGSTRSPTFAGCNSAASS
jgi:hypothetical protein